MTTRPNILIILSDQLRRNALSCYGDNNIQTSNIDALAESGVQFNAACSTYPVCVPFRFTLMTGQYAHTRLIPSLGWRMSPTERTFANEFNEAGYETAYFGKWHLYGGQVGVPGFSAKEEGYKPVPRSHQGGWKHWCGFDVRNNPFDTNCFINNDPTPHKIDGYQTDGLTNLLIEYIQERKNSNPFCYMLSVEPPHDPFIAPKKLAEKWRTKEIKLPPNFMQESEDQDRLNMGYSYINNEDIEQTIMNRKLYYAMIENLDYNVGRIVEKLKRIGEYENTIIIFMADHGALGGSHHLAHKQLPYEESIGIPLIISGPGISANCIDRPVSSEDLFPTILGLAGLSWSNQVSGMNFSPLIRGNPMKSERSGILLQFIWEQRHSAVLHKQLWRGFRSQDYKYTVLGDIQQGLTPWQFFDIKNDPYETDNLIHNPEYTKLIKTHHQWMRERMLEIGDDAFSLVR